jgi:hypothetical protein
LYCEERQITFVIIRDLKEAGLEVVGLTGLAPERDRWRALVNMVMILMLPYKAAII